MKVNSKNKRIREKKWKSLCSVEANVLDYDIVVSEFEFQSRYYVHFRTNAPWERSEPLYPPSYGLNSITAVLLEG